MTDFGTGPKGDGKPCPYCERLACDGYCEQACEANGIGSDETITTLYLRSVPADVKRRFKAWCAEHGVTMTDKITELMRSTYEVRGRTARASGANSARQS